MFAWAFMLMKNLIPGPRAWLHFTYKFIQSFLLLFSLVMLLTHMEFSRNTTTHVNTELNILENCITVAF